MGWHASTCERLHYVRGGSGSCGGSSPLTTLPPHLTLTLMFVCISPLVSCSCGNVCGTGMSCYNGICAESMVACGSAKTFSGNEGNYTYSITIGTAGSTFNFAYNAYNLPDRFNVFLPNGTRIFTRLSGTPGKPSKDCKCSLCRSEETFTNSNINLKRPTGVSSVRVVVNGYCKGRASVHQGAPGGYYFIL